ncbi:ATP-binding protein [Gemmata sp. G18]|uniref:ATP-binding protein n=1 Tax=Gemmata palustris TaxID=2822762 RepID=A0ABS5BNU1_9BACT|nr:ATP-binding protein [Gemmata palustris]MBP3955335.1 ATP-binding protein [Gemmata palustris]
MKVALTGASSTGKTTLIDRVLRLPSWPAELRRFLTADARSLLAELGHHGMDVMKPDETRSFQQAYFLRKRTIERDVVSFITDRSFVDVAAYWAVRDTAGMGQDERDELVTQCRQEAAKYDLHVYLPFGSIPFVSDGYRPTDLELHKAIDLQIRAFLDKWGLRYRVLETADLDERVDLLTNCTFREVIGGWRKLWGRE